MSRRNAQKSHEIGILSRISWGKVKWFSIIQVFRAVLSYLFQLDKCNML